MNPVIVRVLACVASVLVMASGNSVEKPALSAPALLSSTKLRVLLVENSRIEPIDRSLVEKILARTIDRTKQHLNINVEFEVVGALDLMQQINSLHPDTKTEIAATRLDVRKPIEQNLFMKEGLNRIFNDPVARREAYSLLGNVAPSVGNAGQNKLAENSLRRRIGEVHYENFSKLQNIKDVRGESLINDDLTNEYNLWAELSRSTFYAEVIITNQLIASTERHDAELHSALRGGIANGLTIGARRSKTGSLSVLSLFTFTNISPEIMSMRDGESSRENSIQYSALMLTHELGHQLLHLGHPFSDTTCVMAPPHLLHFKKWSDGLMPAVCRKGQHSEMIKGAIDIRG